MRGIRVREMQGTSGSAAGGARIYFTSLLCPPALESCPPPNQHCMVVAVHAQHADHEQVQGMQRIVDTVCEHQWERSK